MSFYTISNSLPGSINQIKTNETGQYTVAILSDSLWVSSDYGVTFTERISSGVNTDIGGANKIACSADGQKWAYIDQSTGIWTSNNYGATWGLANTTLLNSITSNADFSILTGSNGTSNTYYSTDGGSTILTRPGSVPLRAINGTTNHLVAIRNDTLNVYTSDNYGVSWAPTFSIIPAEIACIDSSGLTIYASRFGNGSFFYYSTDSGTSWNQVDCTSYIYTINCSNNGAVASLSAAFGSGPSLAIYYTTNRGSTWTSSPFIENASTDNWDCSSVSGNGEYITSGYYARNFAYTFSTSGPPICYAKGTKILCEDGYKLIEEMVPGDLVQTYRHGMLPVKLIGKNTLVNNPEKPFECMYKLPRYGDMTDDLIVTGGHGILKRSLTKQEINADSLWFRNNKKYSTIDKMYLQRAAFNADFEQIKTRDTFEYYHISLHGPTKLRRYGIWANGILSESTFEKDILKLK